MLLNSAGDESIMEINELQSIVLKNTSELAEMRDTLDCLTSREQRATSALALLRNKIQDVLSHFDRDGYKATDQRLLMNALAMKVRVFDELGYEINLPGARFLIGVSDLLEGRNAAALEHLQAYITHATRDDINLRHAYYLAGMIFYNRMEFSQASEHFRMAFLYSPRGARDWQSRIYTAELSFLSRQSPENIARAFSDVEQELRSIHDLPEYHFLWATLYLKMGNCYADTFLEPKQVNPMMNRQLAVSYYKEARRRCPRHLPPDSLLPVVIEYSLAQALLNMGSVDMDIAETPQELLKGVFERLRKIVLQKREEIILAQSYFMLGTTGYFSGDISRDMIEIYLEHARHQTLEVPSDIGFYSCVTKELLTRDEFVGQIDFYTRQLESTRERR